MTYTPKYLLGDRVFGHFNKIPFIGTVAIDSKISEFRDAEIKIFLDLPLKHQGKFHKIVSVKHKDIKPLVKF